MSMMGDVRVEKLPVAQEATAREIWEKMKWMAWKE